MIRVTRLNDSVLMINVEMIRSLQATPDTVITFSNNDRIIVKEPVEEVSKRIVAYQRAINSEMAGDIPVAPDSGDVKELTLPRKY
jgi:flagellar protein FlbD